MPQRKHGKGPEERGQDKIDRGPGAHSGRESEARDRVVPGTASAREGYTTSGGTAHGEPIAGVEAGNEGEENTGKDTG